ncbi:MAG: FtsX-like permease family protein [Flavobacteriales bacterium]
MNVAFFISRRYLFAKKSRNIINVISAISMFVVAMVTAAMITVLSAFNGIESLVSSLFSSFDPEITVLPAEGKVFEASDSLITYLAATEGVSSVARVLEDDVVIRFDNQPTVATLKGVDTVFTRVTDVRDVIRYGEFKLESNGFPCAIVGYGIQSELGLPYHPTEYPLFSVSAPIRGKKLGRYKERALNTLPVMMSGVFSINAEMDVKYILTPLAFARELFNYENEVSALGIAIADKQKPEKVKERLAARLGPDYIIETRYDRNALIHQTNRTEKWATFLILTFIMVIAGFNIMASLTMLIIEKRNDIFILQSMGFTAADIRTVFSNQGFLINAIGMLIGLVFGLGLCFVQQKFGLIKLQGSIVPAYPIEVRPGDIAGILFTVLAIGTLFSTGMVRYLIKRFVH